MEFGELIQKPQLVGSDLNTKFVGFSDYNSCIKQYFSHETINIISRKLTQLLQGVDPKNRQIIIPDDKIGFVMDSIYQNYRPPTGDIYGRYNVPSGDSTVSYVQDMIDQVIEVIYADVKNNLEMEQYNSKLSAWVQVLGDFNDNQLRSYAPIKTRVRRPNPLEFNMKY
jgi:hypothetical protein